MLTEERRKNPRFKCLKPADFSIQSDSHENIGVLRNISREGLAFESSSLLKEDQQYYFEIRGRDIEKNIPVEVHIVWVSNVSNERYLYGTRIVNMDSSAKIDLLDTLYEDWKQNVIT